MRSGVGGGLLSRRGAPTVTTPVVVKIGGSVLRRPDCQSRLAQWADQRERGRRWCLVAGGGAHADAIRVRHARHELDEESAHWEAIAAMDANARRIAGWLRWPLLETLDQACLQSGVLLCLALLRGGDPGLTREPLPVGWHVTSDSIAARVASVLDAELVLVKATPPPADPGDLVALACSGYVDPYFPRASVGLRNVQFQTL